MVVTRLYNTQTKKFGDKIADRMLCVIFGLTEIRL